MTNGTIKDDDAATMAASWLSDEQMHALSRLIHVDNLQERQGRGSQKFKYIGKEYVTDVLDRIFAPDNWSRTTPTLEVVDSIEEPGTISVYDKAQGRTVEKPGTNYAVTVRATVRIEIVVNGPGGDRKTIVREGTGLDTNNGPLTTITSRGDILSTAYKSAESDAFKRAAAGIGYALGKNIKEKGQFRPDTRPQPEGMTATAAKAAQPPAAPAASRPAQPAQRAAAAPNPPAAQARAETPANGVPVREHVDHAPREQPPAAEPKAAPDAKAATPAPNQPTPTPASKPAETRKPEPAKPAPVRRKTSEWQAYIQELFTGINVCKTEADLDRIAERMLEIRDECAQVPTYGTWFNTVIDHLVEVSQRLKTPTETTKRYAGIAVVVDD